MGSFERLNVGTLERLNVSRLGVGGYVVLTKAGIGLRCKDPSSPLRASIGMTILFMRMIPE